MKANVIKRLLINSILGIITINALLLLKSVATHVPFQFNLYWGLISPIICGAVSAIAPEKNRA